MSRSIITMSAEVVKDYCEHADTPQFQQLFMGRFTKGAMNRSIITINVDGFASCLFYEGEELLLHLKYDYEHVARWTDSWVNHRKLPCSNDQKVHAIT